MVNTPAADRTLIADLDAKIQDLERSLSVLRSQKSLAEERLDAYIYPVLTLPNEIVCEIFLHFLPIYPACPPLTGLFSPILLTHICRGWREIALALPALWRAIMIHPNRSPASDLVSTVLSRSGPCPLSICAADERELGGIHHFLLHCARWEYLTLHLDAAPELVFPTIGGSVPLLRHLDIWLWNDMDRPIVSLREAPLLRSAILNDHAAVNIVLPWAQLTSLTLTRMWLHECIPILQKTFDLVHCELELYWFYGPSPSPGAEVTLPSLESLALTDPDPEAHPLPSSYLQHFIIPALRSLQIPERFLGPDPIHALTSFISKSGCQLLYVDVTNRRSVPESSYRTASPAIPTFVFTPYASD
ncbi:hypothetical protein B0H14DRAFT_186583 [Mycena olivaceomarginata]|nr:hypothetical protein B0H14DRAFT_186583 [Mycena olivaceomarginata]